MSAETILLVEDDRSIASIITAALQEEGFRVDHCASVAARDERLAAGQYAALITDVMLEDGDGIATLDEALCSHATMPVIILSAQNTLDTAVRASEAGAFEYFPKPFDLDELINAVSQAISSNRKGPLKQPQESPTGQLPLVGRSQAMQTVYRMITRVLRNDLSVLILGESGTGKELVAEAIHKMGHRKDGPFVAVNMAAIPAELIESELFGHEKGSFTGAVQQSIGKFEQASGGTLFLDEIGDMPMQAQTRLLRTLQTGRITRVGGNREIALDVRIIAATHRDFAPMIATGQFREDLYYRLNVVPIELPPLRERASDIPALVEHFLRLAVNEGLARHKFEPAALELLKQQYWRGNVRELRNLVFRAAVIAREEQIGADTLFSLLDQKHTSTVQTRQFLPDHDQLQQIDAGNDTGAQAASGLDSVIRKLLLARNPVAGEVHGSMLAELEKPLFILALERHDGNQLRAAKWLGINRNTLRKKLNEYGIDARSPG